MSSSVVTPPASGQASQMPPSPQKALSSPQIAPRLGPPRQAPNTGSPPRGEMKPAAAPATQHARPAGRFVALAGRFDSEVTVCKGDEWVNGCSVLSILSLAAGHGVALTIRASGSDAERAVRELGALVESPEQA